MFDAGYRGASGSEPSLLRIGCVDVLDRSFTRRSVSRPIDLLAEDDAVAETIAFQGAGQSQGSDTEVAGYGEDRWSLTKNLSLNFRGRVTHQSIGRDVAFAPRAGLAYSMADSKLVIRAGAGLLYG